MTITRNLLIVSLLSYFAWVPTTSATLRLQKGGADPLPPGAIARLGTLAMRHQGLIGSVALSHDGKLLASGGGCRWVMDDDKGYQVEKPDSAVRLWEIATGRLIWEARANGSVEGGSIIWALVFSPDGKTLAAGCGSLVYIWDVKTGKEKCRFGQLKNDERAEFPVRVKSLRFLADGKTMVSEECSQAKSIETGEGFGYSTGFESAFCFWDIASGKLLKRLEPSLIGLQQPRQIGKAKDGTAIYEVCDGAGAVSPNGEYVVWFVSKHSRESGHWGAVNSKGTIYNTATGKIILHIGDCSAGVFSPKGDVFVASKDSSYELWQTDGWKKIRALPNPNAGFWRQGMQVSADSGKLFGWYGDRVFVHDLHKDAAFTVLDVPWTNSALWFYAWRGACSVKWAMDLSADAKTLVIAASASFTVFDVNTGKAIPNLPGHRGTVDFLRFSKDGRSLQSSGGMILCDWDTTNWKETRRTVRFDQQSLRKQNGIAVSPGGCFIAADPDGRLLLRDINQNKTLARLEAEPISDTQYFGQGMLSPDGKVLALYQFTNEQPVKTALDFFTIPTGKRLPIPSCVDRSGNAVFSCDSRFIVSTNSIGEACLADTKTHRLVQRFNPKVPRKEPGGNAAFVALSPDARYMATAHEDKLRLWEVLTGNEIYCVPIKRYDPEELKAACLAVAPDNRLVALGFMGKALILLIDMLGKKEKEVTGHQLPVVSLAFDPSGQLLASGSEDTTVLVWDLKRMGLKQAAGNKPLKNAGLEALWKGLNSSDAGTAYGAIRELIQSSDSSVAYLSKTLRPVQPVDGKKVAELVKELNSNQYAARVQAHADIQKMGDAAGPALAAALDGAPNLEVRRRLEDLLSKIDVLPGAQNYGEFRALEVLEQIGTAEARMVLQSLGNGAPSARLTEAAKESLSRLK